MQIANTTANLSAKTVLAAENANTITGLQTFDRDPSAPFAVTASSAVVTNLDADKVDGKDATALMLLDGTQAMTGKLDTGANGQIQFPATQNPSADVNCLDDYEEGTWTPALKFGGASVGLTYTTQTGRYTKVGRQVTLEGSIVMSSNGTSAGAPTITGVPFAAGTAGGTGLIDCAAGLSGLVAGMYAVISGSTLNLFGQTTTGRQNLTEANFADTANFQFSMTYFV